MQDTLCKQLFSPVPTEMSTLHTWQRTRGTVRASLNAQNCTLQHRWCSTFASHAW